MARPRYKSGDLRAEDALVEAFLGLLSEVPYHKVSVRELCRRAGVNKNTFYYHFGSIDELAGAAIDGALFRELAELLASGRTVTRADIAALMATPEMRAKAGRAAVVLSENGAALRDEVARRIVGVWQELFGDAGAGEDRMLCMQFLVGGLLNVLSGHGAQEFPVIIERLGELGGLEALGRQVGVRRLSVEP